MEAMSLHYASETLTFCKTGHLYRIANGKYRSVNCGANFCRVIGAELANGRITLPFRVPKDWFADVLRPADASADLHCRVAILAVCGLYLSDRDRISNKNSSGARNAVFPEDTGHAFFCSENEFHFLKQIAQQQNALRDLP
jgi:hypothetical protein